MTRGERGPTRYRSGVLALCMVVGMAANAEIAETHGKAAIGVPSGTYTLEKTHGYISFAYSHLGFSTPHLGFRSFDVAVNLDADNPQNSELLVTIDANSVDSHVEKFDGHLRGARFFDVANHPVITFKSNSVEMTGDITATITGDLTIKGITHPVTLNATLNRAANHPMRNVPTIGINAMAKVLRSQWGLTRALPAVGDEVSIYVTVELIKES